MVSPETPAPDQPPTHAGAEPVGTPPPDGASEPPRPTPVAPPPGAWRRWVFRGLGAVALLLVLFEGVPWVRNALRTVSTDDAYVNGHVTFVAARVPGQVTRVLVDDNNRVHTGDLLVQLDREPYQVLVNIAQASVDAAQANLVAAEAEARGIEGQARSLRFNLQNATEEVDNQVSLLRSRVAGLDSYKAAVAKAQADYDRALPLVKSGTITAEELDHRKQALRDTQAQLEAALQGIYQIRASLGLPPKPPTGDDLAQVPSDLNQTFSSVREAQMKLIQTMAQLGVSIPFDKSPQQMITDFYKRDAQGDIDRILAQILKDSPQVAQATAKLSEAQRSLDQAKLNLRYTDVFAEIDGVITRREVNPGNNVVAGQGLMAIRSLTDIWVDANFKETQLADIRIGHPVDLYVDMYGRRHVFTGRVSGFTMGTGSTLALLPPENATGNFVKVVQRLPVRIDLVDYDPDNAPLFVGLSVRPYVHVRETPTGPQAGQVLQPHAPQPSPEPTAAQNRQ
jgi:membrane fusion protein (multidrug efflux system)